ncbi:hypothetical protein ISF_04090 [Cordyceps fumosorosea ARSEF 2679]|uniref:Ubiquitin-like domain-containing protein n=1 Tax=Cordyceps fumosorosea (strain ARSEF 2679) TaxID=1081104 RepID=A0A162JAV1_CORFA|nr:hypothetical protein ISF_04090 [Cordyceps fumosorosea ARSEF 2679]OAA66252.1 hypothetical protein ISF_04090 [Cordyceps fumosorosea ARSEF 2679]
MRRTQTSVAQYSSGEPSPLFTPAYPAFDPDTEVFQDPYDYTTHEYTTHGYTTHDEEHFADDDEEVSESEASVSYGGVPPAPRAHPTRLPLRPSQPLPHQQDYRPARRVPNPAPSVEYQDEYGAYSPSQFGRGGYNRHSAQHQYGYGVHPGQVMPYGGNPFSPASSPYSNPAHYAQDPRAFGNEMAAWQHPQYYGHYPGQFHQMAHPGMPLDVAAAPPPPAPPAVPGKSENEEKLQNELQAYRDREQKQLQAEREKEIKEEARRSAAEENKKAVQELARVREQQDVEIQRAREEAAQAARDGIAAEAAAAAEREKQKAEAIKQAEERIKIMFEQARRAEEEKKKKEAEEAAKMEADYKLRVAAALRADAEAKEAAAKAAADEAERIKGIQEEAKRKADAEFAAKIQAEKDAAAKAAEAAALAKAERDAYTMKVQEETKAKLEAQAKTDRGPSLQFKDALGRKYSFPFRLCTTWPDMEELIKQAFDNVDDLAFQVHEGWYDLVGPNNQIILPSVWERVIQPEWAITMSMWPTDRMQRHSRVPPHVAANMARGRGMGGGMPPAPPAMGRGGIVPPDGWANAPPNMPAGIHIVRESKGGKKEKEKEKKKKKAPPAFVGFFGGKPVKKA